MAFDPSSAQLVSHVDSGFDPTTAQPVNQPSIVASTGAGLARGALDATGANGTLLNNALHGAAGFIYGKILNDKQTEANVKAGLDTAANYVSSKFTPLKEGIENNPSFLAAEAAHPVAAGIGGGLGYTAASIGEMAPVLNPISKAIGAGIDTVAPTLAKSPMLSSAANMSLLNTGLGAAANPDQPLKGAWEGFKGGLPYAALGGYANFKLSRQGDIAQFEAQHIIDSGGDPTSIAGNTRIIKGMKDSGADMTKVEAQIDFTKGVAAAIKSAGPLDPTVPPAISISKLAQTQYSDVQANINKLKAPLVNSEQTFAAPSYQQFMQNEISGIRSTAIQKAMPKITTDTDFDELWNKRQELDQVISATKASDKVQDTLSLPTLTKARNALSDDMTQAAKSIGLEDNWNQVNDVYNNQMVPFQSFTTTSGKLVSPEDVTDAMKTINKLFNPRIAPDITKLNGVVKALGPNGQQLVGQAMLQNIYMKARTAEGTVKPETIWSEINKADKSGISDAVWGKDARQAAIGLAALTKGGVLATKPGSMPGMTAGQFIGAALNPDTYINPLLQNRGGIQLLKLIGGSKNPQAYAREFMLKYISGYKAIQASQKNQ